MPAALQDSQFGPDLVEVRRSAARWKGVLALTVLLMLGLLWAAWVEVTSHERQQALAAAARRQANLAVSVAQYLARALGSADAVANYLAGVHATAGSDLPGQVLARARVNTLFAEVTICLEDGSLLSSRDAASAPARPRWCQAWLAEAGPEASSYPGLPVRVGGATLVPLLSRLPAAGGRPGGVVALLVDVRSLLGLLEEYSIPDETVVVVAGPEHRVRARWHSASRMGDQQAPEAALLPAVLAGSSQGQVHEVQGRPVLATARSVAGYPLSVLITTSVADTLEEPAGRAAFYSAAAATGTVVIVLFALVLLRLQDRALRTTESLGRARLRLQALNDELEEQVRARTCELEAAYRDLEAFSYTVAHDVRAPIAAIRGFADALGPAVEAGGNPKSSHYLRRIVANATQMNELTEALLALGKLSRPAATSAPVDLSAMARAVLDGLREREAADRAVEASVQDGLVVLGDQVLLRQVLENLLGNAWKFSAARAPARIELKATRDQDGWLTIAISDNGEGFDSAAAPDLFKPFRRMHAPGSFPGTGVGLAIVERILRLHGGRAWIESSPAQGTTVFFTLRAEASEGPPPSPPQP